jgi:hypothetical protein
MISKALPNFAVAIQFRNLAGTQDWRMVQGYPKTLAYFDASITFEPYSPTGSTTSEALNGSLRSEITGFRASVSLRWNYTFDVVKVQELLNLMLVGSRRLIWSDTVGAYNPDEGTLTNGPTVANYFAGQPAIVQGEPVTINAYSAAKLAEWTPPVADNSDLAIEIYTLESQRLRLLFYPDQTKSDNFEVTLDSYSVSALIEAQITRQPVNLELRSTQIFTAIPDYVILA